jgi:hypothetical protein
VLRVGVDVRQDILDGRQVTFLTKDDVPILARAIVACIRKLGRIDRVRFHTVEVIKLTGVGFNLYVRSEDWLKIAPYLLDGTLNPTVTTFAPPTSQPIDVSTIDLQDRDLYVRVYNILLGLFPHAFPTSKI